MSEQPHPEIQPVPKLFDAIVACGMGPLELRPTRVESNFVAKNVYNFLNAISAKLLVAHGGAEEAIVSGYASGRVTPNLSEAALLQHTFARAKPKWLSKRAAQRAEKPTILEPNATTTFGNIIQAINLLDKRSGGYWEGTLGVISSEFHGPRVDQMLKMFGVRGQFLSAERIFKRFGYTGRLHPLTGWQEHEEATYRGQPDNYKNLLHNPQYVTKYLGEIKSPRRLHEMASSLKEYILVHDPNNLPDVFRNLPDRYDETFDYVSLRKEFEQVPSIKKKFVDIPNIQAYRKLASRIADETTKVLNKVAV